MIGTVFAKAGDPIHLEGYADDFSRAVTSVEFSLDEGKNWTRFDTPNTDAERLLRWQLYFTLEEPGTYTLRVRSANECDETSPEYACVSIRVEEQQRGMIHDN